MMRRKPMITKACPSCDNQIAVASKKCKCGHAFFNTRSSSKRANSPEVVDERRRTSRIKRGKPNYYDSQEFDKRKKRVKKTRQSFQQEQQSSKSPQLRLRGCKVQTTVEKSKEKETTAARAKRRRLKKEEEDDGGDPVSKLSPEKQELATIILAEINRKLGSVVWYPT